MNRAELLALAERCEKAEGPNKALDAVIAQAVGWVERDDGYGMNGGWFPPHDVSAPAWFAQRGRHAYGFDVLPFTSSLDAALTLVPEWHGWALKTKMDGAEYSCSCWRFRTGMGPLTYAATPALALCAAALRARAAKEGA